MILVSVRTKGKGQSRGLEFVFLFPSEPSRERVRERSHMTSARFWQILSPLPLSALSDPPDDVSICQTPPFQSNISFSKNPLHSTLIETLNVYLIQLKTELCRQFRGVY